MESSLEQSAGVVHGQRPLRGLGAKPVPQNEGLESEPLKRNSFVYLTADSDSIFAHIF